MSAISSASASGLQDQFLKLLVAQVQNQNPLDPVSDTEFISQLASFNQLSSLQTLNANFSQLLQYQQLGEGSNLIGKTVTYKDTNGQPQTGKVSGVTSDGTNIALTIGSASVGLGSITKVT